MAYIESGARACSFRSFLLTHFIGTILDEGAQPADAGHVSNNLTGNLHSKGEMGMRVLSCIFFDLLNIADNCSYMMMNALYDSRATNSDSKRIPSNRYLIAYTN